MDIIVVEGVEEQTPCLPVRKNYCLPRLRYRVVDVLNSSKLLDYGVDRDGVNPS